MFEDSKIGFVVNDRFAGKTIVIPDGEDEVFDNVGKMLEIK